MVRVGIVGIGFMGMIHYLAYRKVRGAKVAALCETDAVRLAGDWRTIKGNFGPPGEMMDLSGIAKYPKYEDLLADPKIDMIDICLPPAMHAKVAVAALEAGKHVMCEKPIALKVADAERMVAAAKKAGKLLAIGHVLPFFPEYNFAYKAVSSGKYGKPLGGYFKRIISDPLWMTHFYDPDVCGGPMVDLHIHDAHFIRLLFGMPEAVQTLGRMRGQVVESFNSQFYYPAGGPLVTAACGVINQQGRAFTHGFEVYLEKATLLFDFAVLDGKGVTAMPLTVLNDKGKVEQPALGSGDPIDSFAGELTEAVKAINQGAPSALLDGRLARDALILGQKQTESVAKQKKIKV